MLTLEELTRMGVRLSGASRESEEDSQPLG